jgi:hypothetical protein
MGTREARSLSSQRKHWQFEGHWMLYPSSSDKKSCDARCTHEAQKGLRDMAAFSLFLACVFIGGIVHWARVPREVRRHFRAESSPVRATKNVFVCQTSVKKYLRTPVCVGIHQALIRRGIFGNGSHIYCIRSKNGCTDSRGRFFHFVNGKVRQMPFENGMGNCSQSESFGEGPSSIVGLHGDLERFIEFWFSAHIKDGNPCSLVQMELIRGRLDRLLKIFLGRAKTILGDSLLRGDGVSVVQFSLGTSLLHLCDGLAGNMSLPKADSATQYAAQRQNASEPYQASVQFNLLCFVISIVGLCFAGFLLKIIDASIKNGDSAFVMNYIVIAVLVIVGQFTCYLIFRKLSEP